MKQFIVTLTNEEYQVLFDLNQPTVMKADGQLQPVMHSLFNKGMVLTGGASGANSKGVLVTKYLRSKAGQQILHLPEVSEKLRDILINLKFLGDEISGEIEEFSSMGDGEHLSEWNAEQDKNDELIAWLTGLLK